MRATEASRLLGVSPSTVRKYANEGRINFSLNPAGQRVFTKRDIDEFLGVDNDPVRVFYVRSSSGDAALMSSQEEELTKAYGSPTKVYKDRASGLSESRSGLSSLLKDASKNAFNEVCVTYSDRLSRFGVSYISALLAKDGVKVTVLHDNVRYSLEEELLNDFMTLIASFSGRFYRLRSKDSQRKFLKTVGEKL